MNEHLADHGGFELQVTLTVSGAAACAGGNLRNVEIGAAPFSIGRSDACGLSVQDEQGAISRVHCELREQGGKLVLTDLSSNGTFVQTRGNRLVHGQPTPLPDSVTIYVGGAQIDLQAAREGGALGGGFGGQSKSLGEDDLFGTPKENPGGADPFGLGGGRGAASDPFGGGGAADPIFDTPAKAPDATFDRHAPSNVGMHFSPSGGRPAAQSAPPARDPFASPAAAPKAPSGGGMPDDWLGGGGGDPFADLEKEFSGFGGGPAPAPTPAPAPASDPFGGDDPFGSGDPFADADPFGGGDPFAETPTPAPAPALMQAP
ncbi:MAG: type VI secretion system protein ImpI/type VI secretion system protein, partial [Paracoccaceae bacterium]